MGLLISFFWLLSRSQLCYALFHGAPPRFCFNLNLPSYFNFMKNIPKLYSLLSPSFQRNIHRRSCERRLTRQPEKIPQHLCNTRYIPAQYTRRFHALVLTRRKSFQSRKPFQKSRHRRGYTNRKLLINTGFSPYHLLLFAIHVKPN